MSLPRAFLDAPIAHRGLHGPGVPENSLPAFAAAIAGGYGIELDLQLSADGVAMVFHDATLDRMTAEQGPMRARDAADLTAIALGGGDARIPTLAQTLAAVAGAVPLLIELKDQSGGAGGSDGALERATLAAMDGYAGPVALMSFNPDMVAALHALGPGHALGLTTCGFAPEAWPHLRPDAAAHLRRVADFERVGASFISHDRRDLDNPAVLALRTRGVPVLSWTIRSATEETAARTGSDNVTFEGYRPAH